MGKNSVAAQVVNAGANLAGAPERETARAVGLDGVVDGIQYLNDAGKQANNNTIDFANNQKKKDQQAADDASAKVDAANRNAADTASKQAAAQAAQDIENERMSAGSTSRTLLTGPSGLEDDENTTITRRTLSAR